MASVAHIILFIGLATLRACSTQQSLEALTTPY
jgi:hypothetical protein